MYMPTLARFTSRDPLPNSGDPLLGGVARAPHYAHVRNNPVNRTDPSGRPDDEDEQVACKISIHCWKVKRFGFTIGTHCGFTVSDSKGTTWIDGSPGGYFAGWPVGCIKIVEGIPPDAPPTTEYSVASYKTEEKCECIRNYMDTFNEGNRGSDCAEYNAFIDELALDCTSNFGLKCMKEECGIPVDWNKLPDLYGMDCERCVRYKDDDPPGPPCCLDWETPACPAK